MLDRQIRLAAPQPEKTADVPAARVARIKSERAIDQRDHRIEVLAGNRKRHCGVGHNASRPSGLIGVNDIRVSTRESTLDPWSTPVNFGPTVNYPSLVTGAPALSWEARPCTFTPPTDPAALGAETSTSPPAKDRATARRGQKISSPTLVMQVIRLAPGSEGDSRVMAAIPRRTAKPKPVKPLFVLTRVLP